MRIFRLGLAALTTLALADCKGCDPPPPPDPPIEEPAKWQVVASGLSEAVLSVGGRSNMDVWAVGADKGQGPLALHHDGVTWTRMPTGHTGHLWWVHPLADGTAFMGGASGAILFWDGTAFTRMDTPGMGRDTVFGLWGTAANNMYAVGGFSGRAGFIWKQDGSGWRALNLPANIPLSGLGDSPGFFKVWGDQANHVWVVGGGGVLLRSDDGETFTLVQTNTTQTLFTVAGTVDGSGVATQVTAVGGGGSCVVLNTNLQGTVTDQSPAAAPLFQGVSHGQDVAWASGEDGVVYRRNNQTWEKVEHGLEFTAESLHATFVDPAGGVWAVGGNVLSPALTGGVIIHYGKTVGTYAPPAPLDGGVVDSGPPVVTCPANAVDLEPNGSMARRWNEQLLNAVRRDVPRPGVHARNLFHLSAAMWDAWAAYDSTADGVFVREKPTATDVAAARDEAVAYAAFRVLNHRYNTTRSVGFAVSQACFRAFMDHLGFDPDDDAATGDGPRALGNRIGAAVIAAAANDGANEGANYADTTGWTPTNPALVVDLPGVTVVDPSVWQQINLFEAATQNGLILPAGEQKYIGPNWGEVTPFALAARRPDGLYLEPGAPPLFSDAAAGDWAVDVIRKQAWLAVEAGATMDISPGAYGNNPLGSNAGLGHPLNPVTGQPYAPNVVPRGDFGRTLAEFWADGPKSETPPGHWNTLANTVSDHPLAHRRVMGVGPELEPLEWDVKMYLAINGAVHDAAIVAWGVKRKFLGLRPITLVRHMAKLGQSTDSSLPNYNAKGLPLVSGLIEVITAESSAAGQRHAHLARFVGQVAVLGWAGEPGDRLHDNTPIAWMRGVDWVPYQRRTFVTPAFPGFVSGHSTFSRAAAVVLEQMSGSIYFPGGLGEFVAEPSEYLVFEDGPSVQVRLQWATYADAADQAGQSRIWGGIHIEPDDFTGRTLGAQVGAMALLKAQTYWNGTAVP